MALSGSTHRPVIDHHRSSLGNINAKFFRRLFQCRSGARERMSTVFFLNAVECLNDLFAVNLH
jgi:hypothetical protein